jgi:hypothetical protein
MDGMQASTSAAERPHHGLLIASLVAGVVATLNGSMPAA